MVPQTLCSVFQSFEGLQSPRRCLGGVPLRTIPSAIYTLIVPITKNRFHSSGSPVTRQAPPRARPMNEHRSAKNYAHTPDLAQNQAGILLDSFVYKLDIFLFTYMGALGNLDHISSQVQSVTPLVTSRAPGEGRRGRSQSHGYYLGSHVVLQPRVDAIYWG